MAWLVVSLKKRKKILFQFIQGKLKKKGWGKNVTIMKQNQYGLVGLKVKTFLIIMMQINTENEQNIKNSRCGAKNIKSVLCRGALCGQCGVNCAIVAVTQ